ncbi:predicted protein [Sclerotinia sclerotiorum 1980 UF-70]|uniref:Uncharacterized protein n=1 Tax=Sclerotinia sclerotiorum (strain ATCC 18683 / 1980 / Ss-1) TaxID=665079 RepID=A7F2U8_SCLS1|nr:predicted protein [Sclerotinia sclerotiorum 1980 UF-70]EDN96040.1 predicted protein [Sclerotinia sclerotiorum 1980 UF-70]
MTVTMQLCIDSRVQITMAITCGTFRDIRNILVEVIGRQAHRRGDWVSRSEAKVLFTAPVPTLTEKEVNLRGRVKISIWSMEPSNILNIVTARSLYSPNTGLEYSAEFQLVGNTEFNTRTQY